MIGFSFNSCYACRCDSFFLLTFLLVMREKCVCGEERCMQVGSSFIYIYINSSR